MYKRGIPRYCKYLDNKSLYTYELPILVNIGATRLRSPLSHYPRSKLDLVVICRGVLGGGSVVANAFGHDQPDNNTATESGHSQQKNESQTCSSFIHRGRLKAWESFCHPLNQGTMAPRSPWDMARASSMVIQRSANSGPQESEVASSPVLRLQPIRRHTWPLF